MGYDYEDCEALGFAIGLLLMILASNIILKTRNESKWVSKLGLS